MFNTWQMRMAWRDFRDKVNMGLAWLLPREVVKWAYVRVVAEATSGPYSGTIVPAISAMDALQRWK